MNKPPERKRYNLVISENLYQEIENVAKDWDTTTLNAIKRLLKISIAMYGIEKSSDTAILLKENGELKEIRWFL